LIKRSTVFFALLITIPLIAPQRITYIRSRKSGFVDPPSNNSPGYYRAEDGRFADMTTTFSALLQRSAQRRRSNSKPPPAHAPLRGGYTLRLPG
jgi:hypothetical protein